ncbi:hypothetical protein [Lysinibacillus fusiformis]|uniref:hypothetical protein n=1 Tax=Lysinibacillus fusiformis TaxID=28031 RepID=UPI003CEA1B27
MARKPFTTTIDEDVQTDFKKACSDNDDKMNDVLEAFMKGYIDGDFTVEKEVTFKVKGKVNAKKEADDPR